LGVGTTPSPAAAAAELLIGMIDKAEVTAFLTFPPSSCFAVQVPRSILNRFGIYGQNVGKM